MSSFGYRNYIISNSAISNSYVNAPNYGPYSKQYPGFVSTTNGVLNGVRPNPAKFSIMDTGNDFSSARQAYVRVFHPLNTPFARQTLAQLPEDPPGPRVKTPARRFKNGVTSIQSACLNKKNYIAPMTSGESLYLKKVSNIGKSSLKQGLPAESFLSNKCYDKNFTSTKIKRARSSGCVAPKKCGSIYNNVRSNSSFVQSFNF